jgi:hypothetical protein
MSLRLVAAEERWGRFVQFTHPQTLCIELVTFENHAVQSQKQGPFVDRPQYRSDSHLVGGGGLKSGPKTAVRSRELRLNQSNRSRNRDIPTRIFKAPGP